VAIAKNFEVVILNTNTLKAEHKYQFNDVVSQIRWSPDGAYILIGIEKRAQAFVKSLTDPEWQCKIDEGLAGLVNCIWAPTSRHIITISEFNVRLTVWSMIDKSVQYIQAPKYSGSNKAQVGLAFSPNQKIMALIEKDTEESKDMIGLYDLSTSLAPDSYGPQNWKCMHQFFPDTFDAQDLMFTQDGNHLIVWESPIKNNIQIYQIVFSPDGILDIQMIDQIQPYDSNKCLGVRELQMAPNKQYLMAGYCDQRCRMISTLSWKEVFAFNHSLEELTDENSSTDVNIYVESETPEEGPLYEAVAKPYKLDRLSQAQISPIQKETDLPKVGVSKISMSFDSVYLATVNEQCPTYVWIWDMVKCQLNSLIQQREPVKDICWAPSCQNLNISSSNNKIFLWSLRGASVCQVPTMNQKDDFKVTQVAWNPNGKNFSAIEADKGVVFVYP
jgi:WD40 repeat protein